MYNKKDILWIFVLVLLVIPFINSIECTHNQPLDLIPCEIITPNDISSSSNCTAGNYNYSITDLNTTLNIQNGSMIPKTGGAYNFSFNQNVTAGHSYRSWICDGSTQDFNIIYNQTSGWELGIIAILLIISFLFAYISMEVKPDSLVNTAISLLLFFLSIYLLIYVTGTLRIFVELILAGKVILDPLLNIIDTANLILIYLIWILIIYYLINMTKEAVLFWQERKKW